MLIYGDTELRYKVPDFLKIDCKKVFSLITDFIKTKVEEAKARGIVMGLSGGTDSTVTAKLAVEALGRDNVLVLIMPEVESSPEDIKDAVEYAEMLGLNYKRIEITGIVESVLKSCGDDYYSAPRIAKGNVKARARMIVLYYFANKMNRLVLGTGNKSEILLGYFTKYGDGGVDLLPLGDLFKSQVRLLGDFLELPEKLVWKSPSPGLWPGHKAAEELGATYEVIDPILYLFEKGRSSDEIAKELKTERSLVDRIFQMVRGSEHKRRMPPICRITQSC